MGADIVDKQIAALRDGGESIAGALSDLDAKLTEWLAAMQEGQAAVVDGLTWVADTLEAGAPAETASVAEVTAELETVPEDESVSKGEAVSRSEAVVAAEPEPEPEPPPVAKPGRGMFQKPVRAVGDADSDAPAAGPESEQPGDESASAEDDEALLASLDEETASAIRVKRRLSNDKRSVRELLEELQAERPKSKGTTQQRGQWWRRGNEQQGG